MIKGASIKKKVKVSDYNVLTGSEEALVCRSELLGQEFDFNIHLSPDGELYLAIDDSSDIKDVAKVIAEKCKTSEESVLPLLVVSSAVLFNNAQRKRELEESFAKTPPTNSTIH